MEEVIDTSKLQLTSLKAFLKCLGYHYYSIDKMFISDWRSNRARAIISFNTAVKLHNGNYFEWHGKWFDPPFDFCPDDIQQAMESRIVKQVHLQLSRKKGIVCPKHRVKFVIPENAELLLKK